MQEETPEEADGSTHFVFSHKVFSIDGCYFEADGKGDKPQFLMPLGEEMAAIPLSSLCREFSIADDSNDGALLDIVAKSLKYVKIIRPNDSIPRELLDGSASWSVEDRHRAAAQDRIRIQLVTLLSGREEQVIDADKIEEVANDPKIKRRVQGAFAVVAEKMGLAPENKQEIINKIKQLGHELSFIEGLRECFNSIESIMQKVERLSKFYGNQTTTRDELSRVKIILGDAILDLDTVFAIVDSQTCELLTVLRSFDTYVAHVREARDDLHRRFMDWDEIIEPWKAEEACERGEYAEQLVKQTYKFLAQKFPKTEEWSLVNRG